MPSRNADKTIRASCSLLSSPRLAARVSQRSFSHHDNRPCHSTPRLPLHRPRLLRCSHWKSVMAGLKSDRERTRSTDPSQQGRLPTRMLRRPLACGLSGRHMVWRSDARAPHSHRPRPPARRPTYHRMDQPHSATLWINSGYRASLGIGRGREHPLRRRCPRHAFFPCIQ